MEIYIIRLSDNDLSLKLSEETKKSCELHGYAPQFFEGVKAKESHDFLARNNLVPHKELVQFPGTAGCFSSHYSLWLKCIESNQPLCILEHDAIMIRPIDGLMNQVVDVCHLDRHMPFNIGFKDQIKYHNIYNNDVMHFKGNGLEEYPDNDFYTKKSSCFRGAYGYIITPPGAQRVVNYVRNNCAFPSDRCLCKNALYLQRVRTTHVRLNPFFKTLNIQRKHSARYINS